ncbi:MAG: hypothetical protein ACLUAY_07055 [Butyricicoccus sp.]
MPRNGAALTGRSGSRRARVRSTLPSQTQNSISSAATSTRTACSCPSRTRKAGVANTVFFERADATKRDYSNAGVLFANPPYGERLLDLQQAEKLYADLGRATKNSPMKQYLLSSDPLFERCYGRKADKRRKLYNGMIKCELHMYFKDPSASNRGENKHSDRPSAKRPAKR